MATAAAISRGTAQGRDCSFGQRRECKQPDEGKGPRDDRWSQIGDVVEHAGQDAPEQCVRQPDRVGEGGCHDTKAEIYEREGAELGGHIVIDAFERTQRFQAGIPGREAA